MSSRRATPRPKRKRASHSSKKNLAGPQGHLHSGGRPPSGKSPRIKTNFDTEHGPYLQALLENNPLATIILDTDHRVRMCNPAFERLFGYAEKDIVGREIDPLLAMPGRSDEQATFVRRAESGETVRAESTRRHKNGSVVDVRVIRAPLVVSGKWIGSFAMYEDTTEQDRAERAQRQAEDRFRRLFENAIEGIFQTTPDGKYISVNPALSRMYGYASPEELMGAVRDIGRAVYADPQRREEFKRLIAEHGVVERFEYQVRRRDGSIICVSENARAVRDQQGRIVCYEGSVEDVTDRKRAELEQQVTTKIIHSMSATHNLDDLLHSIHAALKEVLYAENCFVALYERPTGMFHFPFCVDQFDPPSPPQKLERSCTEYIFRTGRPMIITEKLFKDLVASGRLELIGTPSSTWIGVPLRTPDATIGVLVLQHYEDKNAYTERDLQFLSSIGGQIAFAIERKRSEERARASEARLRVLIEQLPAILWTVDRDLRFTSAVGAGLLRLGLKPDEIVGVPLQEYFETLDQNFVPIASHRRAIDGDPVTFQLEWKGGSYDCHVEPLRGAGGEPQGAICMALDVTDRKRLEEQFRQAQKMEAVGRLAGGIAHDFNNLLMVIQGYADLMGERLPVGDGLRRNAEQIQIAAQRATSLTRQLLAFSRKQILDPKVLNIQGVVADMEEILHRLIGEDIELKTSAGKDLGLVKADRSQIEQVIMNLAVNARDAMPTGGRLTIEASNVDLDGSFASQSVMWAPGKYVMLAVTDNGSGMDAATQAHIFEPFFTTKEKGKGTGLGLATVYGIVKQSDGYIWVYSEPGRGTSFKIYLPRIAEEASADVIDRSGDAGAIPRGFETVLLVEDESGVRELAREYLETSGYKVIQASNGHEALELAAMYQEPIQLLMTDVVMPGISGRELADRISLIRPDIKILYMSGYTEQAVVHHGIMEEDTILLQKPFTLATLASKLREILAVETVH
jgi:two-component system, cell cycle sensor histidine kinase and response regulator CckA